jgi:hypothetical protein
MSRKAQKSKGASEAMISGKGKGPLYSKKCPSCHHSALEHRITEHKSARHHAIEILEEHGNRMRSGELTNEVIKRMGRKLTWTPTYYMHSAGFGHPERGIVTYDPKAAEKSRKPSASPDIRICEHPIPVGGKDLFRLCGCMIPAHKYRRVGNYALIEADAKAL